MTNEIANNKCPACGGALNYTGGSAPKFCEHCGVKLDISPVKQPDLTAAPSVDGKSTADKNKLWIATGKEPVYMLSKMVNRHGLIAGATGTGKTVSIKVLSEALSDIGISVFLADIKGDVSGLCKKGESNKNVEERVKSMNIGDFAYTDYPTRFFDVYGKNGIPARATISDMGPLLLARILGLNETQSGILQIIFKIADDNGLLLIDLKDLRAMVQFAGDNAKELSSTYGNISTQSVGTIQRNLLTLASSGGDIFFGEPALDLRDWLGCDDSGRGFINILDCVKLFQSPLLYSTFLLWMLSGLYEMMPEVGDLDKPKIVFFFDEAHILFNEAPKALLQKIEQVVRLIRSKGVGIYFITQSPSDIPDSVLSQLGNKIQHALRAYTPNDQKALKAAAASFRSNPEFSSEKVLGELSTGEALISVLDEKGAPKIVQRAFMLPPKSFIGSAEPERISGIIKNCPLYSKYSNAIDRESAYEVLQEQKKQAQAQQQKQQKQQPVTTRQAQPVKTPKTTSTRKTSSPANKALSSAMTQIGRAAGKALVRGLFGNIKLF
ncbi:helicase HerA-like domain-containing protein [Treponema sp. R80B11-R83G3]